MPTRPRISPDACLRYPPIVFKNFGKTSGRRTNIFLRKDCPYGTFRTNCSASIWTHAKGPDYEISPISADQSTGSAVAIAHHYQRSDVVQRRPARRQPGVAHADGH